LVAHLNFAGVGVIALHPVTQDLGTGSIIFSVQVALLSVSNYAFERMNGTHM
jgi:hypothetical protein